jgi:hypothetical protein
VAVAVGCWILQIVSLEAIQGTGGERRKPVSKMASCKILPTIPAVLEAEATGQSEDIRYAYSGLRDEREYLNSSDSQEINSQHPTTISSPKRSKRQQDQLKTFNLPPSSTPST